MRGRLSRALIGLGVAVSAAITALPAAAQSVPLEPVGEWQLTPAEESCSLWRNFGSGRRAVTLTLTSYGPDSTIRVWLAGESIPRNTNKARIAEVQIGDDGEKWPLLAINGSSGTGGLISFYVRGEQGSWHVVRGWSMPGSHSELRASASLASSISTIMVENSEMDPVALSLGDTAAAFAQMDQCRNQLVRDWGFDPSQLAAIAKPSIPIERMTVAEGLTMPEEMVLNRQTMTVQLRMAVSADGHASDCVVQTPVLAAREQRALCRPFRTALFEPARDADGNAVPSLFRTTYTYYIFD